MKNKAKLPICALSSVILSSCGLNVDRSNMIDATASSDQQIQVASTGPMRCYMDMWGTTCWWGYDGLSGGRYWTTLMDNSVDWAHLNGAWTCTGALCAASTPDGEVTESVGTCPDGSTRYTFKLITPKKHIKYGQVSVATSACD